MSKQAQTQSQASDDLTVVLLYMGDRQHNLTTKYTKESFKDSTSPQPDTKVRINPGINEVPLGLWAKLTEDRSSAVHGLVKKHELIEIETHGQPMSEQVFAELIDDHKEMVINHSRSKAELTAYRNISRGSENKNIRDMIAARMDYLTKLEQAGVEDAVN